MAISVFWGIHGLIESLALLLERILVSGVVGQSLTRL